MSKTRALLAVCCALALAGTMGVMAVRSPTGSGDFLRELRSKDPLLQAILSGAGESPAVQPLSDYKLEDRKSLYNLENAGNVVTLMVEVYGKRGDSLASFETPETARTLKLPAIVREGTEQGTTAWNGFGSNAVAANATLEVKGEPKINRKYHNFKIRLESGAGQFDGQTVLNLKKAYGKPCRIEEKFAFDLFAMLPEMMSLRTRFVHLYIMDKESPNPGYIDYGLYTMVEQPDKYYFTNRSLDDSGSMYQAENFDFSLSAELVDVSSPTYSKSAFEEILDIKQGDNHKDLLEMLAAVGDESRDIDEVIDAYFDRDNVLTWMAMNVVLANSDCVITGYLLYKPTLSQKWFILPGNMSEAMPAAGDPNRIKVCHTGCSMFYGNVLYERILQKPENVAELQARVAELMDYFDDSAVRALTDQYIVTLADYLVRNPDRGMLRSSPEAVIAAVGRYRESMLHNVAAFEDTLLSPRKVELLDAERDGSGGVTFRWTPSAQPGGAPPAYTLEISAQPDFSIVAASFETEATEATIQGLPQGYLYWRVTAADADGRIAGCVNTAELPDETILYGEAAFLNFVSQ